ncbi:DUF86 domain-containing protein [Pseudolabrys taiwanensis]|uniref:DUF86 domain-containing protein n=1 Tax=Pseudolabrys taiwanensis TaxID=331696 RepID=A0A345ZVC4_9HYPH|nr:HepT-like ribonuclease domain-containing protein [Pseudolabrys taiwanensis]AXK80871.1 DUF86 domain-containing protein [Pseudolabrys taiwanensis]
MHSEKTRGYLEDMLRHIELAERFTTGLGYEQFCQDERTLLAVIRCLEIVSEASRRLPDDLKARHVDIPWPDMAAAGNFYRHDYGGITSQRVWNTLREHLPPLRKAVEQELARD